MDFEYHNGTGPVEARSPFAQVSINAQPSPSTHDTSAKKRKSPCSYSIFGSSNKTSYPSLRGPASQPHFFSQPSPLAKPLPVVPAFKGFSLSFSTPRKLDDEIASSEGGDTPRSPEHGDSEANTPDNIGTRSAQSKLDEATMPVFKANTGSPKKTSRPSLRERLGIGASPGRSEVPRGNYSHALEKKINKKRNRDAHKWALVRRRSTESEDEDNDKSSTPASPSPSKVSARKEARLPSDKPQQQPQQEARPHSLYTFFHFIESHPSLPHILSFYAQLLLNAFIVGSVIWLIFSFWSTIRSDVDKKSNEAAAEILVEMAVCAREFRENRCERDTRVPAMEVVCNNWEKCMNRDPKSVGRARVSAHTFAEIFNSFIEPISYKAMVFSFILIFGCVAFSNLAFGFFRSKTIPNYPHNHYDAFMLPPPTPQRHISGQDTAFYGWQSDRNVVAGLEPAPSGVYGHEGQGSPTRRLAYN
ncbi:hypothetical protein LTR50_000643 [Elasticomyces elasticus]|nr:hypothetical protein LTR50_000643 [Elasticomyces elasticus]